MTIDFPNSPTGTTGMQKAFSIAIRRVFRDRMNDIYSYMDSYREPIKESLILKSQIDVMSMQYILSTLEGIKLDLSPVVKTYIAAVWWKSNKDAARYMKLGDWVPFNQRIIKLMQDEAYKYLYKYVNMKQSELKMLLQEGISQGDSILHIASDIRDSFKMTSWKSEQIARSETIKTYAQSTKMAIQNARVTQEYQWKTSLRENVCIQCRPLHNKIFNVNDPNAPMPVISTHTNCNCGIIPYIRI